MPSIPVNITEPASTSNGGHAHLVTASLQDRGPSRFASKILNMSARTGVSVSFLHKPKATAAAGTEERSGPLPVWPAAALLYPRPAEVERPTLQYLDPPAQPTAPRRWRVFSFLNHAGSRDQARDPERQWDSQAQRPKRFMGVLPWIQSQRARAYVVKCLVSGLFLVLLLAVYLILTATKSISPGSLTVLGVLIVILAGVFFLYNLARMAFLLTKPPSQAADADESRMTMNDEGYFMPREPMRVVLAVDEDMVGLESQVARPKPPAYGYWRESVRVNPNALFWQRNTEAMHDEDTDSIATFAGRRPPSYVSEDGVSYVVEAVPRSTSGATTQVYLPS
jgi:hypothetical protein